MPKDKGAKSGFQECGGKVLEMGLTRWEPWRMAWLIVRVVVEEGMGKE